MTVLTSQRHEVDADPVKFTQLSVEKGWGDGLPLIPPTPDLVAEYVAAAGEPPEKVVGAIPPMDGQCTVEKIAINAAMTAVPVRAMPLLIAAVDAMTEPDFQLYSMTVTTAPVTPALVVNGPARHELGITFGSACMGGGDGSNATIGRAIRLIIRNVGGHRVGVNSASVFGQPARTTGLVFGEWEEQSPWEPLAQRLGVPGNAVTAFATMGNLNIIDNESERADLRLDRIGRSLAYPGSNGYRPHAPYVTIVVALNPVWAAEIAEKYPTVGTVQERLWDIAALPITTWPAEHQGPLRDAGMVAEDGRVHVVQNPDRILVVVCGGRAALHAMAFHGNGACVPTTRAFDLR